MDIIAKLKQNGFNGNVGAESSSFDSTTSKSIDAGSAYLDENSDGVAMRIQSVNSIRFLLFVIRIQSVIMILAT